MIVDLNCDLGEGIGDEAAILPAITSASIACGLHAGDAPTMRRTLEAARRHAVAVGAHPSFPDREGFGRRAQDLPPGEIFDHVLYQIGALAALAARAGLRLQHVKAHGALYHAAARRPDVAEAVAEAARAFRGDLVLVGLAGSALAARAASAGQRFAAEAFADRAYGDDGALLPRADPRAVLDDDDDAIAARAVWMVREQRVPTISGVVLDAPVQTLCLHGDDPRAAGRARAIAAALARAGLRVAPLGSWL